MLAPLHALCYRAVPTLFISVTQSTKLVPAKLEEQGEAAVPKKHC